MLIVSGRILLFESEAQIPFPPSVNQKSHLPWQNPQGFGREGWADLAPRLEGAGRYRYFYIIIIIIIIIIIHPMRFFCLPRTNSDAYTVQNSVRRQ